MVQYDGDRCSIVLQLAGSDGNYLIDDIKFATDKGMSHEAEQFMSF
ncbi:MAG: hypothetical protein LBH06_02530 [Rikenellaceae bacterium]|jgi:hypothetical protein|nr:hypothetical protein [Rikenellaceae bacterium]